ncbi:hypothetical protein T06_13539 [Trichinella sp. T6]|nr:hypothetical protein T06_13539 [Trichinella sp. T6]
MLYFVKIINSKGLSTTKGVPLRFLYFKNAFQRFWKVPRQTNGCVSNKWPLKSPCAYLNTQGSSPCGTPLILINDRKFFDIIMRYSLKLASFVQYFVVLSLLIFLHFRSISNT